VGSVSRARGYNLSLCPRQLGLVPKQLMQALVQDAQPPGFSAMPEVLWEQ
jgi:hypothetical protein